MKVAIYLKLLTVSLLGMVILVSTYMVGRTLLSRVLNLEIVSMITPAIPEMEEFSAGAKEAKQISFQIPTENTLIIPKISVNATIFEGESEDTLDKGMWHRPLTSSPDMGGNTVIAAHRRKYISGPNTFYLLDRVVIGDEILVYWKGEKYLYKVFEMLEVNPDQLEIEDPTSDSIITLYTCTPLGTSDRRLVVKGKLQ